MIADSLTDDQALELIRKLEQCGVLIPEILKERKRQILEAMKKTNDNQGSLWQKIKTKLT